MKLSAMRRRYRLVSHLRFLCFVAIYLIAYLGLCSVLGELLVLAFERAIQHPAEYITAAIPAFAAVIYLAHRMSRFV